MIKEIKYTNHEDVSKIYITFEDKNAFEVFKLGQQALRAMPEVVSILVPRTEDRYELLVVTHKKDVGMIIHVLLGIEDDIKQLHSCYEEFKDLTPQQIEAVIKLVKGLK